MPAMDGLDTLSHLLEIDHSIPVIINTAYASYQESFTSWSADAYIVKSSDLSELKQTVKRLLELPPDSALAWAAIPLRSPESPRSNKTAKTPLTPPTQGPRDR